MLRLAVLAVALVILGGCYTSESFLLDASQAARIVQPGPQLALQADGKTEKVEVVPQPDGWYEMRDEESKPVRMIFTPIPGQKDRFFMAAGDEGVFLYGVALRQGGRIGIDMADCGEKPQAEIAAKNGAKVEGPTCHFSDRTSLTKALAAYAKIGRPMSRLPTLPAVP